MIAISKEDCSSIENNSTDENSSSDENIHSDLRDLSNYLNSLPEMDSGILPPIDFDELNWTNFQDKTKLSSTAFRYYHRNLKNIIPKSKRHQIYCYYKVMKYEDDIPLTSLKLSLSFLFDCPKNYIYSFIHSYKSYKKDNKEKGRGRPKKINPDQIETLYLALSENLKKYNPMSKSDIILYIKEEFDKTVSKKWVSRLLKKDKNLISVYASPLIDERTNVTKKEINDFYSVLKESIEELDPELVFNVDEIGFSRKNNGKKRKCIILKKDFEKNSKRKVYYEQENDLTKTFSLIACISLSGEKLKPMIIAPVQSCPVEFFTESIWPEKDCVFGHSETGFNNTRLFEIWFEKVFIPHVRLTRQNLSAKRINKGSVLICDGMEGHNSDFVRGLAAKENIKLLFLPAHSSHILQALDQYIFANVKSRYYSQYDIKNGMDRNSKKILKILKSFYMACTPFSIRASFETIGVRSIWNSNGEFLGIKVDCSSIIENHQDKLMSEVRLNRKRNYFEPKYNYFINHTEILENSFGICSLCHQIIPSSPVQNQILQNKAETLFITIRTLFDVLKIILHSYISAENRLEVFQSISKEYIDIEFNQYDNILKQIKFDQDIEEMILDNDFICRPKSVISMIHTKIFERINECIGQNTDNGNEKNKFELNYLKNKDLFDLKPISQKNFNIDCSFLTYPSVRGFVNHKYECAMNASLQILLHTTPLIKLLLRSDWEKKINPQESPMMRMMTSLAMQLWSTPTKLTENFEIPPLSNVEIGNFLKDNYNINFDVQQDAFEILTIIISQMASEFEKNEKDMPSNPIKKMFYGTLCDEVSCKNCGHLKCAYTQFNALSIPFNKKTCKLFGMIKKWCSWCNEKKRNEPCENCQKKSPVRIRTIITEIPMIFILSVPRYLEENYKLDIEVQETVNFEKIIKESADHGNNHLLYGFISHDGNTEGGHYVSHVNVGENDWNSLDILHLNSNTQKKWVLFNDTNAKEAYNYSLYMKSAYIYAYYGKYLDK